MAEQKIKRLASDAKKRLISGYWTCIRKQRDDAIEQARRLGRDIQPILTYFREKCARDIAVMTNSVDRCEEALYQRVKELWDSGVLISNPAFVVGDAKYAERLSDTERQRYIMRMIAKYNELRARYDREKELLEGIELREIGLPRL